ncbi:3592_t:CDS:2, partial [Acaulospora morrowiae]
MSIEFSSFKVKKVLPLINKKRRHAMALTLPVNFVYMNTVFH